jgi:tetratricopeptide (TPR) repeat protein
VLFFAAGLMAKPMLVTLPFVLLLLDYWPLGRFPRPSSAADNPGLPATGSALRFGAGAIVAEKLPFILMTAASCIVTYMAQQQGGAVADIAGIPFGLRSANALISYVGYIGKLLYPSSLAVFYPLRAQVSPPLWQPLASLLMIAVMSLLVLSGAARRRYLAVGWFWYLGMLVPVIGLVQVGGQSMADRYVYLPAIGIFIMCIWAAADFVSRLRYGKVIAAFAGGMVLAALLVCTRAQVRHWKDSASLYTHALAVTTDNWVMHNNYGEFLRARGDLGEAVPHLQEAIRIYPAYAKAHNNLGCALRQKGQLPEAAAELKIAIEISPDYAKAHNNYGVVLSEMKLYDKAIEHYTRALTIDPYYSGAARNLYTAGVESGKLDAAAAAFRSLTDKGKGAADLYYGIAMIDMMQGRFEAAADNLRQVLRMQPQNIDAMGTLAYMLATCPDVGVRRPPEAVSLAEKACELTGYERPELIDLLSQAYAVAGRLDMAQQTADKAAALALSQGKTALAEQIKARIQSYEGMQPK